jgi:hypothetical protein
MQQVQDSFPEKGDPEYPPFIDTRQVGVAIEGVIERYSEGPDKFHPGQTVPIAVIRQPDGKLGSIWINTAVMKSKWAQARPTVDERVIQTCLGQREGANATYWDFKLELPDRPAITPDWGSMVDEEEAY